MQTPAVNGPETVGSHSMPPTTPWARRSNHAANSTSLTSIATAAPASLYGGMRIRFKARLLSAIAAVIQTIRRGLSRDTISELVRTTTPSTTTVGARIRSGVAEAANAGP